MNAGAMISVPPGQVTLSDRRTRSRWPVEVAPFLLAAVPVTQSLYARVTGLRPSTSSGDRLPVEGVSWWDAVRFCNALSRREGLTCAYHFPAGSEAAGSEAAEPEAPEPEAARSEAARSEAARSEAARSEAAEWDASADGYRLPTEAEWEHACRAGSTGPRYGELDEIAWYQGNSEGRIHPVGGKRPNAWGLYDMLGNAWDWCWDLYDPEVYGTYRVLRGGGWADEHWSCRASVRRRSHPTYKIDDVTLRLARSTPP